MCEKGNFTHKNFASKKWNEHGDTYNDYENASGTTTLRNFNNIWYFFSTKKGVAFPLVRRVFSLQKRLYNVATRLIMIYGSMVH